MELAASNREPSLFAVAKLLETALVITSLFCVKLKIHLKNYNPKLHKMTAVFNVIVILQQFI